jgi:hypothetical protein
LVLTLAGIVAWTEPAYANKYLFSRSADGLTSLNVSGGSVFEKTTISLFCKPTANEHCIALVSPEIGMPREDVDVTLKAGGKVLGTYRFARQEGALILIIDGTKGRALVERASAVSSLAAMLSGHRVTFALSGGASHVKAFRKACGFSPA